MLQKIAAMMDNVAADLYFMASKVRLLLQKKNYYCRFFCRYFYVPLYTIRVLNTLRLSVFVPKIRESGGSKGVLYFIRCVFFLFNREPVERRVEKNLLPNRKSLIFLAYVRIFHYLYAIFVKF